MRKKALFILGLFLVAGSAIGLSSASRYQYHLYQYPYNTPSSYSLYRPSSNRISPWQYRKPTSREVRCVGCDEHTKIYSKKYENALRNSKNNRSALSREERLKAYRARKLKENPRYANTYQSKRYIIREGNYKETGYGIKLNSKKNIQARSVKSVSSNKFEVNLGNFKKDKGGVFRAKGTTLAYQVSQTPKGYKCETSNFWNCATSLNKNFKSFQGFSNIREQNIDFRWNQTNNLDFSYFPTVTENFDARSGGNNNTYFIFNALNPKDGSIIRIEGVAGASDKERASQIMYDIFESFRFKKA